MKDIDLLLVAAPSAPSDALQNIQIAPLRGFEIEAEFGVPTTRDYDDAISEDVEIGTHYYDEDVDDAEYDGDVEHTRIWRNLKMMRRLKT